MSEHIQPLLERIHTEGLKKAEAERDAILDQARADAHRIREQAEREAGEIREQAEADAAATRARSGTALEQAARDTLLQFRSELNRQLEILAGRAAAKTLSSAEQVAELLQSLMKGNRDKGKALIETRPELGKTLEPLLPALLNELGEDQGVELILNPRANAGFTLRFENAATVTDITDASVAGWLSAHLRPELAALLKRQAGK